MRLFNPFDGLVYKADEPLVPKKLTTKKIPTYGSMTGSAGLGANPLRPLRKIEPGKFKGLSNKRLVSNTDLQALHEASEKALRNARRFRKI